MHCSSSSFYNFQNNSLLGDLIRAFFAVVSVGFLSAQAMLRIQSAYKLHCSELEVSASPRTKRKFCEIFVALLWVDELAWLHLKENWYQMVREVNMVPFSFYLDEMFYTKIS